MAEASNDDSKKYYLLFGACVPVCKKGGAMSDKRWRQLERLEFNEKWPRIKQAALRKIRKDGAEFVLVENTRAQVILFATASPELPEALGKNPLVRVHPLADRAEYDSQIASLSQPLKAADNGPTP